jgi:hypothetical protein
MEDPTEIVDWELPEPATDMEELQREVRSLQIYVKTLSQNYAATWRQINFLRKTLRDLGIKID